jgi:hypothetical protein
MVGFGVGVCIESVNAVNREAIPPVLLFLACSGEFFIFKIRMWLSYLLLNIVM